MFELRWMGGGWWGATHDLAALEAQLFLYPAKGFELHDRKGEILSIVSDDVMQTTMVSIHLPAISSLMMKRI